MLEDLDFLKIISKDKVVNFLKMKSPETFTGLVVGTLQSLEQWFPTGGACTPRGPQSDFRGSMTFSCTISIQFNSIQFICNQGIMF